MSNPAQGMPYPSTPDIPPARRDLGQGRSPAPVSSAPSAWLVNLRQRVVTAGVLIPVVLAVVWLGGWAAFVAAAVVVVVGTWELRALCARRGWHPLVVLSGALSLDFLLAAMLPNTRVFLVETGISAFVVASFVWLMLTRPAIERTLIDWALTLAIPFYLGWSLAFVLLLRGAQVGYQTRGFWWVLVLLLSVWAHDSAALVTGHAFGRHRLAPHLSPNKTWEGTIGGLVGAIGAVVVVTFMADWLLPQSLYLQLPWYQTLLLGGLIALAATLGDLAKSLLKRGTGVKESGAIFPGHGGMLDRVDSVLFAAYVVYFYALSFGALH